MTTAPPRLHRIKLREFSLPVGVDMLIEPLGVGKRHKTTLVGLERGKYLIVRLPAASKGTELYHHNRRTVVQYKGRGGYVCGFKSVVVGYSTQPFPLLFLQYPEEVDILDMRVHERLDCFLPASVALDGSTFNGLVVNLSPGGCRISVDVDGMAEVPDVTPGSLVACSFTILNSRDALALRGEVRTFTVDDRSMSMGVLFQDPPADMQQQIQSYVDSVKRRLR